MLALVEPGSTAVASGIHGLILRLVVETMTEVEDRIDARERLIEIRHEISRQKITKGLFRKETERRTITARSLIEKLRGQRPPIRLVCEFLLEQVRLFSLMAAAQRPIGRPLYRCKRIPDPRLDLVCLLWRARHFREVRTNMLLEKRSDITDGLDAFCLFGKVIHKAGDLRVDDDRLPIAQR